MDSITKKIIQLTKPNIAWACTNLVGLTGELIERLLFQLSFKSYFDPKDYPWVEEKNIEELAWYIEELSKYRIIQTVDIMMTQYQQMDDLGDATERLTQQHDALDILLNQHEVIELKYYIMKVMVRKIREQKRKNP